MADVAPGLESTPSQRWLARLTFVLAGAAIVILVVVAGLQSPAMLAVGLAAALVGLAAAYVFVCRPGLWRWLSLAVFVLAPIAVVVVYAFRDLLWVAVLSAAVWLLASITARLALAGNQPDWRMPEHPAQPPARHPYLIMNPKSGGGKVGKFDRGSLGVVSVTVGGARQAAGLLHGRHSTGVTMLTAKQVEITAGTPQIPVGVDGESVSMSTPVTCAISPGALRVWVPRDRPGVPAPKPPVNWSRLRHLAGASHPGQPIDRR
jgi:hypothetical protein